MAASKAWRGLERLVSDRKRPVELQEDVVPVSLCGHCGIAPDRASHHEGKKPKPGDLSICWSCAGVSQFDESLMLKPLSEEEVAAIECDQEQLAEGRALIRAALTKIGYHRGGLA